MTPETQEIRVTVFIPRVRAKDVIKATTVACATILVLRAGADLVRPKLRELIKEYKTEADKWKPPTKK